MSNYTTSELIDYLNGCGIECHLVGNYQLYIEVYGTSIKELDHWIEQIKIHKPEIIKRLKLSRTAPLFHHNDVA